MKQNTTYSYKTHRLKNPTTKTQILSIPDWFEKNLYFAAKWQLNKPLYKKKILFFCSCKQCIRKFDKKLIFINYSCDFSLPEPSWLGIEAVRLGPIWVCPNFFTLNVQSGSPEKWVKQDISIICSWNKWKTHLKKQWRGKFSISAAT